MVKTAVLGASGYLGRALWEHYRLSHPDCLGTSQQGGEPFLRWVASQPDLSPLQLRESGHEALVLAFARAGIQDCESNPRASRQVNVEATLEIVGQASQLDMQVIWFSSDYVFDGRQGGYSDDALPNPETEYGRQKAEVERSLPLITNNYLIVRLSKIYGSIRGDRTLLDEMAATLCSGRPVQAAADQFFSPTHIQDVVAAVQSLQRSRSVGLFNVSNSQCWSRFQIALALADQIGADRDLVRKIGLHDLPQMAGRPLNTSLRSDRLAREHPLAFTPLESSIAQVAEQWRTQ